jgi:DNA-binding NarL/FixJ family response regulator
MVLGRNNIMNDLKVVFIDKHLMFVQGISAIIERIKFPSIKVEGVYCQAEQFNREFSEAVSLDVVIMDLNVEDINGIEFITTFKKQYPSVRLVVLSSYSDYKLVKDAMKNGADGYILKNSDYTELESCLLEVMKGETYLGVGVHLTPPAASFKHNFKVVDNKSSFEDRFQLRQKLTKREAEILRLITQAKSNDEIGSQLYISDQTVGVHKKNIMRKLGARSTMNLIKYALENELV